MLRLAVLVDISDVKALAVFHVDLDRGQAARLVLGVDEIEFELGHEVEETFVPYFGQGGLSHQFGELFGEFLVLFLEVLHVAHRHLVVQLERLHASPAECDLAGELALGLLHVPGQGVHVRHGKRAQPLEPGQLPGLLPAEAVVGKFVEAAGQVAVAELHVVLDHVLAETGGEAQEILLVLADQHVLAGWEALQVTAQLGMLVVVHDRGFDPHAAISDNQVAYILLAEQLDQVALGIPAKISWGGAGKPCHAFHLREGEVAYPAACRSPETEKVLGQPSLQAENSAGPFQCLYFDIRPPPPPQWWHPSP